MANLILKSVSATVLLVAFTACQTTSIPENCTVAAQDIKAAQASFRSSFKAYMKDKEPSKPRLSKVFVEPVKVAFETNSDNSAVNYTWDVKITEGCTLTANLGTNTSDIQGPDYSVSRLTFQASSKNDSEPYFYPISITLNQ